ncbi:MAG: hypothetical protein LBT20_01410 [Clostridiales bacterium]|jgi:hypothetical protein|nr:hypothetical protein [Clostridiales bacterium]
MDAEIEILKDLVEGRTDIFEFIELFKVSDTLRSRLDSNREFYYKHIYLKNYGYSVTAYILLQNAKSAGGQLNVFGIIESYLEANKIIFKPTDYYKKRYILLLDIQPQFLYSSCGQVEEYLEKNVIDTIPEEFNKSKTKRIQYCKAKIKELFRCETKYPYWLQNCEWPFNEKGEPMTFLYQKRKKEGDYIKYLYYFSDKDTGEIVEVEQYD